MTTKSDHTLNTIKKMLGYKPTFGSMLCAIRESEEMSQAKFAKLLKISPQKLCDIEKGRRIVSIKMAEKFAKYLGDSPEYFVIRCLQDELERNQINIELAINNAYKCKHIRKTCYAC